LVVAYLPTAETNSVCLHIELRQVNEM